MNQIKRLVDVVLNIIVTVCGSALSMEVRVKPTLLIGFFASFHLSRAYLALLGSASQICK
jgi:hypothetical protein